MIPNQCVGHTPVPFVDLPEGTIFRSDNPRCRYIKIRYEHPGRVFTNVIGRFVSLPGGLVFDWTEKNKHRCVTPLTSREIQEWFQRCYENPVWDEEEERIREEIESQF